jgi:hypothetical protein
MAQTSEIVDFAAAWKDRKRRYLTYVVALNSFWVLVLLGILSQADSRFDLPGKAVFLSFASWFVVQMAAGVWLNRFRCPRCASLFYWARWTWKIEERKNPRNCRHCGLPQDSLAA